MNFLRLIWSIILGTIMHFFQSNTMEKGAALAYYTVISLVPIMVILIYILGSFFGQESISHDLLALLEEVFGTRGAAQVEQFLEAQQTNSGNIWVTILGIFILVASGTAMFNQFYRSFNNIWLLRPKQKRQAIGFLAKRISSLLIIVIIGFIMVLSTSAHTVLVAINRYLPETVQNLGLLEQLASFSLLMVLFAMMYQVLGDAIVPPQSALIAGSITAILFLPSKVAIGFYLVHSNINTSFGAASTIILLMVWMYYTSQIIFLGACFAYILGEKVGWKIKPNRNAVAYVHKELEPSS